jgi:predicted site-specific integrase-resolvase
MSGSESYVPVEDVAEHLSVKVSTIRQWVSKGFIPKKYYLYKSGLHIPL